MEGRGRGGRLTAAVIASSPQRLNAVGEYELQLRSLGVSRIENMGAAPDMFQSIDLCENDIQVLEGFPRMRRVSTLLLANNRITRVGQDTPEVRSDRSIDRSLT